MKHPASSQLTSYVVVVRVNGSHLIKNYLITFLALISGAWLSLARTPSLPRHCCHLLSLFRALSQPAHTTTSFNPLSPSSTVSCLLHLLLHPPSTLRSQPAGSEISVLVCILLLSSAARYYRQPPHPPCHPPTIQHPLLSLSLSLSVYFHFSVPLFTLFFPCSPEVRLATSYPKRRKLPVNVISLLIRFSSRFSRTADPPPPSPRPVTWLPQGLPLCCRVHDSGVIFETPMLYTSKQAEAPASSFSFFLSSLVLIIQEKRRLNEGETKWSRSFMPFDVEFLLMRSSSIPFLFRYRLNVVWYCNKRVLKSIDPR